jgi:hypothetical protein
MHEAAKAAEAFRIQVPIAEVLAEKYERVELHRPQRLPLFVVNGYLFVGSEEPPQPDHTSSFRLFMFGASNGAQVREYPLPSYLVGVPSYPGGRFLLLATPSQLVQLDFELLETCPLRVPLEPEEVFMHAPVFHGAWPNGAWYVATGRPDAGRFALCRLGRGFDCLEKVCDLPGEPRIMVAAGAKLVVLCNKGGVSVNGGEAKPIPEVANHPPKDDADDFDAVLFEGRLWYPTHSAVACLDVAKGQSTPWGNMAHSGNGSLAVSERNLLVADADGVRAFSLTEASRPARRLDDSRVRTSFSLRPHCWGRYVAAASSDGRLMVFDTATRESAESNGLESVLSPPTYFGKWLWVLAGRGDGGGTLLAFSLVPGPNG